MRRRASWSLLALLGTLVLAAPAPARTDYAGDAFNILAPGEYGGLPPTANSTDQGRLYDALTPLEGHVTAKDLPRYYLSEHFGVGGKVVRSEKTGRTGLKILRDRYDVPHIYGKTRDDVMFGSGWVAAEDRSLLIKFGLGPAYAAALDIPGINAFSLVTSAREFTPSKQAIAFVAKQENELRRAGAKGRRVLRDLRDWIDGLNAYAAANPGTGFTRKGIVADAIAGFAFIGSIFGNGGGDEVANADFLARLERKLGRRGGLAVFRDLRSVNDPEAPTTTTHRFPYDLVPTGATPGSPLVDPGTESTAGASAARVARAAKRRASNFLVVGAGRTGNHHPLAVMGPQLGYYYPEIVMQGELHGGGIDARGIIAPVSPYVFIGRGRDFAWSLTSASSDNVDQFLEKLCVPGGGTPTRETHAYLYKGTCRAMKRFDAGFLAAGDGEPAREVRFWETVHGPVSGTVLVGGKPYAIARDRATRGREPYGELALSDLDSNKVHSPKQFFRAINQFETTFNWPYVDSRHIAYFSSGRLPVRAQGVDPSLPTLGTGKYEWRGFLTQDQHPHAIAPRSEVFTNWNNKPAPGWGASDDDWSYGSVHHVQLYRGFRRHGMTLARDVSIMNRAATEDLRGVKLWPIILRVLSAGPAPSSLARRAADVVTAWVRRGAQFGDKDADGKSDAAGYAIMSRAFSGMADAVVEPVLGKTLDAGLAQLHARDGDPEFGDGWYGYVSKDLRTQLGMHVRGKYSRRYCGNGSLTRCRKALWAAVRDAADALAKEQGSDPAKWRATLPRTQFLPGLIDYTMRWTNRSTFQQAIQFTGHAPG